MSKVRSMMKRLVLVVTAILFAAPALGESVDKRVDAAKDGLVRVTNRAGSITIEGGRGKILQRFLEGSNVDPVKELVGLIRTQRAFELNSQSIQAADPMC